MFIQYATQNEGQHMKTETFLKILHKWMNEWKGCRFECTKQMF